jgi:hypothetical protein
MDVMELLCSVGMRGLVAGLAIVGLTGCASRARIADTPARGVPTESSAPTASARAVVKSQLRYATNGADFAAYVADGGFSVDGKNEGGPVYVITEPACLFNQGTAWISYSESSTENYLSDESGRKCRILSIKR